MLKKKGLYSMTLSIKDKVELSHYRLEKAKKLLKDALNLFNSGSYESSVNRSYYAVLTASKSLLILRGIDPETHEGVKTMLSKEFIRTGILPKETGETFRSIQARRIDSDYGDYIEIGIDEASDSLKRAKEFIKKVEEVSNKMIEEIGKEKE
ncbi:MAG: HEPN domain-containing protein [Thermodesulfovibrionales bacterium]